LNGSSTQQVKEGFFTGVATADSAAQTQCQRTAEEALSADDLPVGEPAGIKGRSTQVSDNASVATAWCVAAMPAMPGDEPVEQSRNLFSEPAMHGSMQQTQRVLRSALGDG
jgi:hypothetical protein